jgi:hypothetical protein
VRGRRIKKQKQRAQAPAKHSGKLYAAANHGTTVLNQL